jgi:Holliday junction resolvasome RuvABC endonuclease subunit
MTKVLGLDISSSCIGWGLLEIDNSNNITYLNSGIIKPPKNGSILERLHGTRDLVAAVIKKNKPDYVGIEDIISFIRNKSTATTIITLAVFNRMIGLLSMDLIGNVPELFSVLDIRHGLKLNSTFPKKEDMPELVAYHLGIKFPYTYITRGKSKGKIHITSYDRADGLAVALHYAFSLTGKTKKSTKKRTKKTKK